MPSPATLTTPKSMIQEAKHHPEFDQLVLHSSCYQSFTSKLFILTPIKTFSMSFKFGTSAGGTPGGGGLYAGIALGGKKPAADLAPPLAHPEEAVVLKKSPTDVQDEESTPAKEAIPTDQDKSKASSSSSWSSSLRFAPVIRKPAVKSSTSKPFAVPFSNLAATKSTSSTAAAFAPDEDEEIAPTSAPRPMHIPGRAKVALNATPIVTGPSKAPSVFARKGGFLAAHAPERIPGNSSVATLTTAGPGPQIQDKVDAGIPGLQHSLPAILAQTTTLKGLVPNLSDSMPKALKKKLDQPPPLTLPDEELGGGGGGGDVNGFRQSEAGRKLALRAARTSKKNKKKGKTREIDPAILFLEDYDPTRPNDYNEWMNFCKRRREERREAIRLEREHQRRKEREELTESSAYSSEDDGSGSDTVAPPAKGKFFAPPSDYNAAPPQDDPDRPPIPALSNLVAPRGETGDEAYARRVALSQGIPYNPPSRATTMEEDPTVSTSNSIPDLSFPNVSIAEAQARAKSIAERLQNLSADNEQPIATESAIPAGPVMPPPKQPPTLEEAQAKARLIAAKLAALSGGGGVPTPGSSSTPAVTQQPLSSSAESGIKEPVNKAPGQPDFARRLMDKYGWKEGQGLGASESGRTTILTVSAPLAQTGKKGKQKQQQEEIGPGVMPTTAIGKGRGVVIDEAKAQRDREEKERYGEPTRVVYLTNVVAVEEIDDELSNEIAEEAGKHGIVERCFVRVVQRPVDDPTECVRVFIIFSGLVGAWKAVKSFDGRFFGGRTIRARFFSENKVTLGDWDS
ncbi:hypothetical protein CROQUDRAFT_718591 [Cronartium quercuum f. sp. fusiforme G11]|uniref:G-patch domain-containing protein n=1 Tax=Cronartium quercuum f. sp. fusiforme G11 TaxID=708437 RepID=A0A9P6T617_9BASI|nr:hypothetical protein CROQUDRAFT_718591 [Cronartium quercuum f. sp. fusiforme G11]